MREIKFRAWHIEQKRMIEIDEIDFRCKTASEFTPNHPTNRTGYEDFAFYELSPLMQFTGLKDKNGKEIWEGDIIETGYGGARVIIWEDGCFHARHPNYEPGKDMPSFPVHFYGVNPDLLPNVIGDIYENKELLA